MSIYDFSNIYELSQKQAQDNSPFNRFAQGFQIGSFMRQQQALSAEKEAKAQEIRKQAEQAGLIQTQLNEIAAIQDPTEKVNRLTNLGIQYPSLVENVNKISQNINEQAKTIGKDTYLPILYAIKNKNYDVAKKMALQGAEAFKNSGNNRGYETLQGVVNRIDNNENLDTLFVDGSMLVSSILGWDTTMQAMKAGEETTQQGLKTAQEQSTTIIRAEEANRAPLETEIKQQEANRAPLETQIKATQAKFEERKALLDLEKKGWDVKKIELDTEIARQNKKIATINAEYARALNETKKSQLEAKRDEAIAKRDDSIRAKAAEIESSRAVFDNTLNTIQRILDTPFDVVASAAGPIDSKTPTLFPSTANFEALVDNLKSQAFMSQVQNMKGLGTLSNAEGEKLQSSVQNLSLSQSANQLLSNVQEVKRLTEKARKNLALKFGVPDTEPDVPAAKPVVKVKRIE